MSQFDPSRVSQSIRARPYRQSWLQRVYLLWRSRGTAYVARRALLRMGLAAHDYDPRWIRRNDALTSGDVARIRRRIGDLARRPTIALLVVADEETLPLVRATIESVAAQLYEKWHLVLACPSRVEIERMTRDPRVTVVVADGAEALNQALEKSKGEFVATVEPGCTLAPHALYLIAEAVHATPDAGIVYTDEDAIDAQGRRFEPRFKPDWSPDLLLSQDYLGSLTVFRRDLMPPDGFAAACEGCQSYAMALRVIESAGPGTIRHVPFVLAHRRRAADPPEAQRAIAQRAMRAAEQHLDRIGVRATVEPVTGGWRVRRTLPQPAPRVSVIIPTRDQLEFLRVAVDSILGDTDYPDYEVVIVDNESAEPATLAYLDEIAARPNVRVLRYRHPFNYSAINNFAARQCESPILALLNNDVKVINRDWLSEMVSHAVRPEVGAVGALLLYPDDVIQHAGIFVGYGRSAINCYSGMPGDADGYCYRARLIQNYSAVTGACLVTRTQLFAETGGLDEVNLPVAFNDVDYCLRLRDKGYLVTWTPHAKLYHFESASRGDDMAPDKIERFERERRFFAERWSSVLSNDPYYNPNLSIDEWPFALALKARVTRPWREPR